MGNRRPFAVVGGLAFIVQLESDPTHVECGGSGIVGQSASAFAAATADRLRLHRGRAFFQRGDRAAVADRLGDIADRPMSGRDDVGDQIWANMIFNDHSVLACSPSKYLLCEN